MAQYLKISSPLGGSCNSRLRKAIIYIGKRYGKLANKEGAAPKEYFKHGKNFIAKKFGAFRKTAILRMVEPKKTQNPGTKQWCYHKQIYGRAYGQIIKLLLQCPPNDKDFVEGLLNDFYQDICKKSGKGSGLARLCSNALLFWQIDMLKPYKIDNNVSDVNREGAGKILKEITEADKPLP